MGNWEERVGAAQPGYLEPEPSDAPGARSRAAPTLAIAVAGLLMAGLSALAVHAPAGGGVRLGVGRPAPVALASAAAALRSHSVRMHIATSATVTTHGRAIHVDVTGGGAVDYSTRACEMTIASTVAGFGGAARNITTELRIVGGYVYVRLPNGIGGAALPPGKAWMRQPVPPALAGAGSNDPSQAIDELRSIATELRVVGTERVGGIETTHYSATVVLAGTHAWASLQAANPAVARNPLMQSLAHQPLNMDAWIDEGGRLRRLTETIHFALAGLVPGAAPGDGEDVHLALDIPDYGAPVRVQPPPAAEVVDQPITGLFGNPLAPPG